MHSVFPSNDHPSDKARFRFRITVPAGTTAVASGGLVGRRVHGGRATWTYREDDPTATELVQIAVGRFTVLSRPGPHGVLLRDVVPTADADVIGPKLAGAAAQMRWMERKVGRYPFEEYGVLAAPLPRLFALETQTLSLFPAAAFTDDAIGESSYAPIQVHELAHHWFGNDVAPEEWSDVWLSESHATWYEALYADERGWASLEERMRTAYAAGDRWRRDHGPVAAPRTAADVFSPNVYDGGALVLYALRQEIGASAFQRLERAWVRRHAGGVAATADPVALASQVAGRDLSAFLEGWLYGRTTPPMPGRPDWTVDPVP
jgi:aminopeptidase N